MKKHERVFVLSPRIPELYFTVLGALKNGQVISPLFSAFGPEPISARLQKGSARALLTLSSFYKKKIAPIRQQVPSLEYILLIDDDGKMQELLNTAPGAVDWKALVNQQSTEAISVTTRPDDMALLHFTSGTTGKPKGAVHVHGAVMYHEISGQLALDIKQGDQFWCTADPGWVTGMSYGIISPLVNGATLIIDEADFQAERWYQILDAFKVDNWYTAPTALRMLMKSGAETAKKYNLKDVRFVASVGEPLNPEVILWAKEKLNLLVHDNWWQTETGGIIISNFAEAAIKPGSMGRPLPGMQVALVKEIKDGQLIFTDQVNEQGEMAIRVGWPSMFRQYLDEEARYKKCFIGEWYLTGDLAQKDADGYFWFVGRADDVIKSSGHLIGPFEVESVLMEHPSVAEAGVIGLPDPVAGEMIKGFVALKNGFEASENLKLEILGHARKRLGPAVAPREIAIVASLPKTRSGKIMRRLLKARELGLPEGDISTLETNL
jgi:acetyl-CoA synthetase